MKMFRGMVDHGGNIQEGIMTYSGLVRAEREKLSRDICDKLLIVSNDDGSIILKLIKNLLEPISTDIVKTHPGEGKNDFTIKVYLKKLKDNRKYLEAMQSWTSGKYSFSEHDKFSMYT